jgi:hypothetical protein
VTEIKLTPGKPKEIGDYLCIRKGHAHPEFARIRNYQGTLTYLGGISSFPLEKLEDDALFSGPLDITFA